MGDPRYITEIPPTYKPILYGSLRALNEFLKRKHILNRSSYDPSPEEIELLALDLNFIPSQEPSDPTFRNEIHSYLQRIDRHIYFYDRPHKPLRGRLSHLFKLPWSPNTDWSDHRGVMMALAKLHAACGTRPLPAFPEPLRAAWTSLSSLNCTYILKADKGGATVLWDSSEYCREANRQLSDSDTYELIPPNSTQDIILKLERLKDDWASNLHYFELISDRECLLMKESDSSLPHIYFLPKIHKPINAISGTYPGRPIVAAFNCHLHWLDKYITEVTNDLHRLIPHSLFDTVDLLRKLKDFGSPLPANLRCFTADVVGLYPSIPWSMGIAATTDVYASFYHKLCNEAHLHHKRKPPSPSHFESMLKSILENSYVSFQGKALYHQRQGTAMGMCISVFFARCYMFKLFTPVIKNPPLHLRMLEIYIDDLFVMTTGTNDDLIALLSLLSNEFISYTYELPTPSTNMLDLSIEIINDRLTTKLFSKPTSSPFYLHANSMHSASVVKSIPKAQLLRIKRNSTFVSDFIPPAKRLLRTLALRGYPRSILDAAFNDTLSIPQDFLLSRPTTLSPQAARFGRSFKLILPFSRGLNLTKIRKALNHYQQAIATALLAKHPTKDYFRDITSEIVFCNMPKINCELSKYK